MVQFTALNGQSGQWSFGDNTPPLTGNAVMHSYNASGDFVVSLTQNGITCSKTIRTNCGPLTNPNCCNAAFTASLTRECGILRLELNAACTQAAGHTWIISGSPCLKSILDPNSTANNPVFQITNINTQTTPSITVAHYLDCPVQQVVGFSTQNVAVAANAQNAIFIGKRGQEDALSEYECVLPGNVYPDGNANNLPVYVAGQLWINKASGFTFLGAQVFMDAGMTGFNLSAEQTLTLTRNTALEPSSVKGAPDCDCLWRGNRVWGTLNCSGAEISDALYAINGAEGSKLTVFDTKFTKNFIGICVLDGPVSLRRFQKNIFDGTGPLRNICTLKEFMESRIGHQNNWVAGKSPLTAHPIVYSTDIGFSGLYFAKSGPLTLPALPIEYQNIFTNLAHGIYAHDTDLSIVRNSVFKFIFPMGYKTSLTSYGSGAAAVRFIDTDERGVNGLRVIGNNFGGNFWPDFDFCSLGIVATGGNSANTLETATPIDIANNSMRRMHHGIYLATAKGTFSGKASKAFKGVYNNNIEANVTFNDVGAPITGIYVSDISPTPTSLQIYNNTITAKQGGNPLVANTVRGIVVQGLDASVPTPQIDIFRNKVTHDATLGGFSTGIYIASYSSAWVHDNRDEGNGIANGVFSNANASVGILVTGGEGNLVGCNDVMASGTGSIRSLLENNANTNGVAVRNNLKMESRVPELGTAVFRGDNGTAFKYQCNEMNNSGGVGLMYDQGASTGDQGSPTVTFGNRWLGTFAANNAASTVNGFNPLAKSSYFVNANPIENPSNPFGGWFTPLSTTTAPTCTLTCPITAPLGFAPGGEGWNSLDSNIATGNMTYTYQAAVSAWWAEHDLYRKLWRNPQIRQANSTAQSFFQARSGSPMAKLVSVLQQMDNLVLIPIATQNNLDNLQAQTILLLEQLYLTDSLLELPLTPGAYSSLMGQREAQVAQLSVLQDSAQTVLSALRAQRLAAIPAVMSELEGISASNVCESNYKTVYKLYLNASRDIAPTNTELANLAAIGSACPFVAGPSVYVARSLYEYFTHTSLAEADCPTQLEEDDSQERNRVTVVDIGFEIFPNPANNELWIKRKGTEPANISLVNSIGQLVLQAELQLAEQAINIAGLSPGLYFVRLTEGDKALKISPILIRR